MWDLHPPGVILEHGVSRLLTEMLLLLEPAVIALHGRFCCWVLQQTAAPLPVAFPHCPRECWIHQVPGGDRVGGSLLALHTPVVTQGQHQPSALPPPPASSLESPPLQDSPGDQALWRGWPAGSSLHAETKGHEDGLVGKDKRFGENCSLDECCWQPREGMRNSQLQQLPGRFSEQQILKNLRPVEMDGSLSSWSFSKQHLDPKTLVQMWQIYFAAAKDILLSLSVILCIF